MLKSKSDKETSVKERHCISQVALFSSFIFIMLSNIFACYQLYRSILHVTGGGVEGPKRIKIAQKLPEKL